MVKKKYFNKNLRNVSLSRVQLTTEKEYKAKQAICANSALSGQKCGDEMETPTVIRDIFAAMTAEEYKGFIERIYPIPEPEKQAS